MATTLTVSDARPSLRRSLAIGAIGGQTLFVIGTLVLGAAEGHGYSAVAHDVSDLGAIGAEHAPVMLAIGAISGAATIAFALGAVRFALRLPGRGGPIGAWLLALSLPAFDNLTDTFFRVDCQAANAGCSSSDALSSWHAQVHVACFVIALLATVAVPFALARRMAALDLWRDIAPVTKRYGVAVVGVLLLTAVTAGTSVQGLTQRLAIMIACGGVIALAVAALRREAS